MSRISKARIREAYKEHPLTATAIRKRLQNQLGEPLPRLTELDLAADLEDGITDQNHMTGVEGVIDIARWLSAQTGANILDVGSGLGGPARLLAHLYGCSIVGIELTENRFRDALALTRLVGLEDRVRFLQGDFLEITLPARHFDGVILIDSFGHFEDKAAVITRCLEACRRGRRVVVQDCVLLRQPRPDEVATLEELSGHWNTVIPVEESWIEPFAHRVRVEHRLPLHDECRYWIERMLTRTERRKDDPVASREVKAWNLALDLHRSGLLGYSRIVMTCV